MALRITKRQSFIIAILAMVGFFAIGLISLNSGKKSINLAAAAKIAPQPTAVATAIGTIPALGENSSSPASLFTMEKFHRSEVKDGRTLWEASGTQAQYMPETNSVRVQDADILSTLKDGSTARLTTDHATIFLSGASLSKAEAEGAVKVVHSKNVTLTADRATYDKDTGSLLIPSPLTIVGDQLDLKAQRLDGDLNAQKFVFSGQVRTVLKPKPGKN